MKKKLCLWMLILCMMLTACTGNDEPNTIPQGESGTVAPNKYIRWSNMFPFVETDHIFYGLLGGRAYYYDRQSGFSDFLCADPSCHDSAECSSYMEQMAALFTYYDGKLYWLAPTAPGQHRSLCLYRCDPDGRNREKVMELDFEKIVVGYNPQKWMIHRGKLFFIGETEMVVDAQACYRVTFGYVTLDGDGKTVLLYDESFQKPSTSEEMLFLEDAAYFAVSDTHANTLAVTQYDLHDNSQEILLSMDPWSGRLVVGVTEAGAVYVASNDTVYQIQNGELKACFSFDQSGYAHLGDGVALGSSVEDGVRMIELRTYEGELIYSGELFPEPVEGFGDTLGQNNNEISYNCIFLGVDTQKLIVCMQDGEMNHYFLLDINNGMKVTHLWSGAFVLQS